MIACLLGGELANGRQHTECIARQHNDVVGMPVNHAGNFSSRDVFDGVCTASVLGDADIIVVRDT